MYISAVRIRVDPDTKHISDPGESPTLTLLVAGELFLSTPWVFRKYLPNGLS